MDAKEQLILQEIVLPPRVCAFTGHREIGEEFSPRAFRVALRACIKKGVDTFLCGMAIGFDLFAGEEVLKLKKKYPQIKLVACVPCYGQEKSFSKADKKRYKKVYEKADEKVCLAESYYRGCMQQRDRYMADKADMLIAYCKKDTGGTAYTVGYFQKKYPLKEVIFL